MPGIFFGKLLFNILIFEVWGFALKRGLNFGPDRRNFAHSLGLIHGGRTLLKCPLYVSLKIWPANNLNVTEVEPEQHVRTWPGNTWETYFFYSLGERISYNEALKREQKYEKFGLGCYIYYNLKGPNGDFWYVLVWSFWKSFRL